MNAATTAPAGTLTCRDLYLRHTDTQGRSTVTLHRVWDADRFLAARVAEAAKANADVKGDEPRKAAVAIATEADYRAANRR